MASDYTSKFSEKYGQLSGADLEILGAREQAATARALRTAFKPTQGQMVGGWYVKPALTQHLADALMQYNNYKNEQAGTTEAKRLIKERNDLSIEADKYGATRGVPVRPGYQVSVPAIESGTTNSLVDEALAGGYGTNEQGQPLFDASPTPSATPSAMPNQGAQAYIPPTAEAQGNVNANPTNNQYIGTPSDMTASDNVPLAQAVRNAPLDNAVAGANNQSAIPPVVGGQNIPQGGQASADGMLPAVTVTPEPEPNRLAQMLRGEGDYAPVQKASVTDVPAIPSNFDQRVYARMLSKASRDAEAANEWKDIETQSTNEQHRLSTNATIAGHTADNIQTNLRYAITEANRLADKKDQAIAIAEAKKEAHDADIANIKWKTKADNETKLTVAHIGADVRKDAREQAKLGRLGVGERYKLDANGQPTNETEFIPGTKPWMKAKSDSSGEFQSLTAVNRGADKLRKDIKSILTDSGFEKSFGQIAGRTPDSAADVQRVASLFRSIEGQLQARGLGINKQENGSIGAMAVAEWEKMASLLAVVKRTDSPEAARNAYKGALDILDGVTSAASQKYQNEWGGGQFDLSGGKNSGEASGSSVYGTTPDKKRWVSHDGQKTWQEVK